ncbi:hypothetical protein SAMN05216522_10613 [Rosenbergiella nectarea]|uniref:Uncharacterized protein n=1 Tax=Rosenbergiella nectarea TaxID=988801 RepID=A0A1H9IE99_9GAMM|nr:hypothetical protein [Rosenbergiella nectarea]SEQ72920.1 hypothetical protein SAMN05216522_10613 [Rosenbergiella nectarea]
MKYIVIALAVIASPAARSMQMEGFGSNYYQDDASVPEYTTNKDLSPVVIVGNNIFVMGYSTLADIAKTTDVTINKGEQASWLCLNSKGVNYWFISDAEMGQGDLTSIAVARNVRDKGCYSYSGDLSVTINKVPLLDVTLKNIISTFSNTSDTNIIRYCNDSKTYGDFTQMNCLQYILKAKNLEGVIISQITSN